MVLVRNSNSKVRMSVVRGLSGNVSKATNPYLVALSGHTETICYLSAFGAKRTCTVVLLRPPQSLLTQSRHERAAFAAMHRPDRIWAST